MPLATCPRCKKMFNKGAFVVCEKCLDDEKEDYEKIQETLVRIPNLFAEELAEIAEVELDCVMRLVESGRIEAATKSSGVKCGRCGAPAISKAKKLCEKCLSQLNAQFAREQSKLKLPKKPKMDIGKAPNVPGTVDEKRNVGRNRTRDE